MRRFKHSASFCLLTLLHGAKGVAHSDHLPEELATLSNVSLCNRFSKTQIQQAIVTHRRQKIEDEVIKGVAVVPYYCTYN